MPFCRNERQMRYPALQTNHEALLAQVRYFISAVFIFLQNRAQLMQILDKETAVVEFSEKSEGFFFRRFPLVLLDIIAEYAKPIWSGPCECARGCQDQAWKDETCPCKLFFEKPCTPACYCRGSRLPYDLECWCDPASESEDENEGE